MEIVRLISKGKKNEFVLCFVKANVRIILSFKFKMSNRKQIIFKVNNRNGKKNFSCKSKTKTDS